MAVRLRRKEINQANGGADGNCFILIAEVKFEAGTRKPETMSTDEPRKVETRTKTKVK